MADKAASEWGDSAKAYERVMERSTWLWGRDALTLAGFTAPLQTPATLLDVACGPGRLALHAAEMGFEVTATDWAAGMLQCVQEKAAAASVKIATIVTDGQTLEGLSDGSFDVVTSTFGIFHFADRLAGWRAVLRVLKPGGRVLATVWTPKNSVAAIGKYVMMHAVDVPTEAPSDQTHSHDHAHGHAHDHDHQHDHGEHHEHAHGHEQDQPHEHSHSHGHSHDHGGQGHVHVQFPEAAEFARELADCGFVNPSVYQTHHDMVFVNGKELIDFFVENHVTAHQMHGKDPQSFKICVLHFLELVSQGIDPITDSTAPRPPTPDQTIPENMALWNKPARLPAVAHIAIAQKPTE